MAAGSASRTIRAPGRLVVNATDLSIDYPYGGTEVGRVKLVLLQSLGANFRVTSEGLGEATDILESEQRWLFSCFLRGWDDEAVEQFFADNFVRGDLSGHSVMRVPNIQVPGSSALTRAVLLLFVPDDLLAHPGVVIYRGIPDWSEGAEVAFQRPTELGIPLTIECLRGDSGKILEVGRLADLILT